MCQGETSPVQVWIADELSHTGEGRWDTKQVDTCIAKIVHALSMGGIKTRTSCCGHGREPGHILLEDGRKVLIMGSWDE